MAALCLSASNIIKRAASTQPMTPSPSTHMLLQVSEVSLNEVTDELMLIFHVSFPDTLNLITQPMGTLIENPFWFRISLCLC